LDENGRLEVMATCGRSPPVFFSMDGFLSALF
jgi:hypothetical protein